MNVLKVMTIGRKIADSEGSFELAETEIPYKQLFEF